MKTLFRRVPMLQWKLTLSYVLITGVVLLLFELFAITAIFLVVNANLSQIVLSSTQQEASQAATYFVHGTPDREGLSAWLRIPNPYAGGSYQKGFLAVVDAQGQVLTATGEEVTSSGILLQTRLSQSSRQNLHIALTGHGTLLGLVAQEANGSIVAISSIVGKDGMTQGALVLKTSPIMDANGYWLSFYLLFVILPGMVFILFVAGVIGPIAGFFTARSFTRRFQKLALMADSWSQGNFSLFVQDTSKDELGQLIRHMNRMAEQLQHLLRTRQRLAILEERNRLARDLHDSVKQHLFVVALQVGTAKLRLASNAEDARSPLAEAERVLLQVQQELKTLIRELRPVALEGKGLGVALRELATQWSHQTTIPVQLQIEGKAELSLLIEEAFFRVTQEALANIARHSQATCVRLDATFEHEQARLSIGDNGQGFALSAIHGKGFGLLSMQERMHVAGGNVLIESVSGEGTTIVVTYEKQRVGV